MQEFMQGARKTAGFTQEEAAKKMFMARRAYQALEYGEKEMTPQEALKLSKVFDCPALAQAYCRRKCAIGTTYGFAILDNVDLSIPGILLKLWQEFGEAEKTLAVMGCLVVNKRSREDFAESELQGLKKCLHRLLNLEHNIEILKAQLMQLKWIDLRQLIAEHNSKCRQRGYVVGSGRMGYAADSRQRGYNSAGFQNGQNRDLNEQAQQAGEGSYYERRNGKDDATLRVEENGEFYRQKSGFQSVVEGAEKYMH